MAGVINPAIATQATMIDLSRRFDAPDDGTTPQDLVRMAQYLGVDLVHRETVPYPYITLVDYESLPREFRSQDRMGIAHWIVRLDDTTYYDPYWWTATQVGPRAATRGVLDAAERNARRRVSRLPLPCRVGFASPPGTGAVAVAVATTATKEEAMKRISKGANLRTRAIELTAELAPKTRSEGELTRIAWIAAGTEVTELRRVGSWSEVALHLDSGRRVGQGYVHASLLASPAAPIAQPPVVVAARPRVGVSILDQHHIANALDGLDVLIMNGIQECRNYKRRWPNANVLCRRFLDHGGSLTDPYSPAMRELHTVGDGVIVVSPHNECDHGHCYHTESDVAMRADFDAKMATECRKHGTLYAGMSVSMGVPDFTRPEV
ncbi:MAG: hypothetical protein L0Y55_04105, partial [Anaerolineales bacterium]|nr:hypothetical protein [Anaerolineales bacterium]